MSGKTINVDETLFRKKESQVVFSGQPKHGDPAWRKNGENWENLLYWNKYGFCGWATADEFRRRKRAIKENYTAFYRAHPELLNAKIRSGERRPSRLLKLHISPMSISELPPSWECSGPAFPYGNGD